MSWSVAAVGKPSKVIESIKEQAARYTCAEPEETVKARIVEAIEASLSGYNDTTAVQVSANGSMMQTNGVPQYNNATLSIQPIYGFLE